MIVGVLTSMNPLATRASAILPSRVERSCLLGSAMRFLIAVSLAASVLDISLENCLSLSAASVKSIAE